MDGNSLQELISDLPEHCIALMGDIDAVFHHTLSRDLLDEGEAPHEEVKGPNPKGPGVPQDRPSRISLSSLLNALDGVGAQEGRLLFPATNRYGALDAGLRRPGRIDVHVEFKLAVNTKSESWSSGSTSPPLLPPLLSGHHLRIPRPQKTTTTIARFQTLVMVLQPS